MPLTFEVRGHQFINIGRLDIASDRQTVNPNGINQMWPDDYYIAVEVELPAGATEITPSTRFIGFTVYDEHHRTVGSYRLIKPDTNATPERYEPSSIGSGDEFVRANGFYFETDDPAMPKLRNLIIMSGKSLNDMGADGLPLRVGNGRFDIPQQAAPCFGPDAVMLTGRGALKISEIRPGDTVVCGLGNVGKVLWVNGMSCQVWEKNRPIRYMHDTYSPQHRILIDDRWAKAKFLVEMGLAEYVDPMPATQEYWHILLDRHLPIQMCGHLAESLLPTDRSLSTMPATFASEVEEALAVNGLSVATYPGLEFPEMKRWEIDVSTGKRRSFSIVSK